MKWTTKEAFALIQEAGLTTSYYVFMKWVREGRIPATLHAKKKGYRFHEQDVKTFIDKFQEDDSISLTEEMERLKRENDEWAKKWNMPQDYWIRENAELKARLQQAELQIKSLEAELEAMKNDRTIRIRVE